MNRKIKIVIITFILFLFVLPNTKADVDKESIFNQARYPASELDLQLSQIEESLWQIYVNSPDEKTKKDHPLITQAGIGIRLNYYGDDRISATGWVTKLDGFLKLSVDERKQLVLNTLELIKSYLLAAVTLVDKNTGHISGKVIENHHIKLRVIIKDLRLNDKKENIRLILPSEIGHGQAGYKDGQFIFSEAYFLNLKVFDGVAASGNPNKYVIEHED